MSEENDSKLQDVPPVGSAPTGSVSDTPRTDDHQRKPHMAYDHLWSEFSRKLERENSELMGSIVQLMNSHQMLLSALAFIAKQGGKDSESEVGTIRCNGSWCAEQARAALDSLNAPDQRPGRQPKT